ncbi:MAG TPA: metal ABC transporter permease [Chloroflexia bacterium]|nr:metal ABC transporter permease [Chloroflexia bacterium]
MSSGTVILLTGILVAVACAMLGTFLVLRKMAMMSDAISHAILPGLVLSYFLANGPNLLAGFFGAALAAVITVSLVEALQKTRRVGGESAIGLVFPAMFALGTFFVSRFFSNVHLDTDAVLYGNIEFAAQDVLIVGDTSLGPQSLWVMAFLCLMNGLFISLFYKELKLATFDPGLAGTLGFSPFLLHYALMSVTSVTAVGAFTAVGAVLVVALMIVPATTAYLLTDKLPVMIGLSIGIGAASAVSGYYLAVALDSSVAGAMASMTGVFFGLALLFSPGQGIVARVRRLAEQRAQFAAETLVVHLFNHENTPQAAAESSVGHLHDELLWSAELSQRAIRRATSLGLIRREADQLSLTAEGRDIARDLASEAA